MTRPPPVQTSADSLPFVTNFLLPRMRTVWEGLAWEQQPDRCVLVLDNACIQDEVSLKQGLSEYGFLAVYRPEYGYNPEYVAEYSSMIVH